MGSFAAVIEAARHVSSYTAGELAAMSGLDLAVLAFRAEDESAALWHEHVDDAGRLPPEIAERASLLSRLSDVLALMARHAGS